VEDVIAQLAHNPVVSGVDILNQVDEPDLQVLHVKVSFIDNSVLYIRETIAPTFNKYAYHWQTSDARLIRRWDNAPHWPDVATHPHHCHVESRENVVPSEHPAIADVIQYITGEVSAIKEEDNYERLRRTNLAC